MKTFIFAGVLVAFSLILDTCAHAQNPTCPTRPAGDSSNACASTAFVQTGSTFTNVLTKAAKCDGSTDDSSAFNAMNASGGNYFIPAGLSCAIGSTVTLGNNTSFFVGQGASIKWIGAASGTMFQSTNVAQLHDFSLIGNDPGAPIIIGNNAGTIFNLHSMQNSYFYDFQVQTNNAAATVWSIAADSDFGIATSLANTAFNSWRNINHTGPVGTVMNITGITLHANPQVVTLNNFNNIWGGYKANSSGDINVCGICFNINVDNNNFDGQTYLSLGAVNAIGVHFNSSASPAVFAGIHAIQFNNLAVDCLAGPFAGRVGVKVDKSQLIRLATYYNNPFCEGGQLVTTNAGSYWIEVNVDTTPSVTQLQTLNWFFINPNITGGMNIFGASSGSFPITASATGSPQYGGTVTNDNAPAGSVGEFISSTVASPGSAITSGVGANITSISLTAGDWDVGGQCVGVPAGTTTQSQLFCSVGTTSATGNLTAGFFFLGNGVGLTGAAQNSWTMNTPVARFSLASTTTVFLVVQNTFGTSTETAWGIIRARRVR